MKLNNLNSVLQIEISGEGESYCTIDVLVHCLVGCVFLAWFFSND